MAVTFTGTSTGKTYEVGKTYKNANGTTSTAQANGTFKNNSTGRVSVGSSQDPRVTWGSTGGGASSSGPSSKGGAASASKGGTGPGKPGVVSGSGYAGVGPGVANAGALSPARAGLPVTTQIWIGGQKAVHDTGWSDGADGEDRWGEWGGGMYGLGVMAADGAKYLGSQMTPKFHQDVAKLPKGLADSALDLAGYLDAQRSAVRGTTGTREVGVLPKASEIYKTGGGF